MSRIWERSGFQQFEVVSNIQQSKEVDVRKVELESEPIAGFIPINEHTVMEFLNTNLNIN